MHVTCAIIPHLPNACRTAGSHDPGCGAQLLSLRNTAQCGHRPSPAAQAEDGPHIQGVLNLLDNLEEDGGTQLVPGFHNAFMEWKLELGKESVWPPGASAIYCLGAS